MVKRIFSNRPYLVGSVAIALTCSGCAQPDNTLKYVPPPGLSSETGAAVTGTVTKSTLILIDNTKVFVAKVDNLETNVTADNWQAPVLLSPGFHLLDVEVCRCGWKGGAAFGDVTFGVNVASGQNYLTEVNEPHDVATFGPLEATAWIQDSSGSKITTPVTTTLQSAQSGAVIPIFVPAAK